MRRWLLACALVIGCGGGSESVEPSKPGGGTEAAAPAAEVDLSWLEGAWQRADGFEHWHRVADDYFGVSFTVKAGKTAEWEAMLITVEDGKRVLTAIPNGQKSADFKATEHGNGRVVFSLPDNDFPRTLEYRRDGASLVATLLGTNDRKLEIRHDLGKPAPAKALEAADREFAAAVATGRLEAWVSWFTPDGMMWGGKGPAVGPDAIRAVMKPSFDDPTFQVTWRPVASGMSPAGDIGYTVGRSKFFKGGSKSPHHCGVYITLWKQHQGKWRAMFDTGTLGQCE